MEKDFKKQFSEMKVGELRQRLGSFGLDKTGVKAVLVDRLVEHYKSNSFENQIEPEVFTEEDGGETSELSQPDADTSQEDIPVTTEDQLSNEKQEGEGNESGKEQEVGTVDDTQQQNVEEPSSKEEVPEEADTNINQEVAKLAQEDGDTQDETKRAAELADSSNTNNEVNAEETGKEIIIEEKKSEKDELKDDTDERKAETEERKDVTEDKKDDPEVKMDEGNTQDENDNSNNISEKEEQKQDNNVDEAMDTEDSSKAKEGKRYIILVTGLSSSTSANDLKTFFRKHGKIGRIKIMTNTRVPGSQRFAHISVSSPEELNLLVEALDRVELKGNTIRVIKAPDDGLVSSSYEIAVATAKEEEERRLSENQAGGKVVGGSETEKNKDNGVLAAENAAADEQNKTSEETKESESNKAEDKAENAESSKKDDATDQKGTSSERKSEKSSRTSEKGAHRSRKDSHERSRGGGYRAPTRGGFRRGRNEGQNDWRRHGPSRPAPGEVTRVYRDRPPAGRGYPSGGRRRSPHQGSSQLTFEQIREIRDEQRRRDAERRKREEERKRAADTDRQKRLEYQNYMEFKQLEREREHLKMERERIEREKLELIKLERERQRSERERIEKEKEELRRAKFNIEHRAAGVKRHLDDNSDSRRRDLEKKKPYIPGMDRGRTDQKTEAERKFERDRKRPHERRSSSDGRTRSPPSVRDIKRDSWTSRGSRGDSHDLINSRDSDLIKSYADRRSRGAASSSLEASSRYATESSRRSNSASKRPGERYSDDIRTSTRETEWETRASYLNPSSSLSLPFASSTVSREGWSMPERKVEAWETSRLQPRTEPWISGGASSSSTLVPTGRSSLPAVPPPPQLYSHSATSLGLSSIGLNNYSAATDRYDGYKGNYLGRRY